MKTLFLLSGLTMLMFGCSKTDPESEKSGAEAAISGFFDAADSYDYDSMRTFVTGSFHAIEDGQKYNSVDEFIEMFKFLEGAEPKVDIDFIQTNVSGNHAFVIASFDAVFSKEQAKWNFKTIDSYVLKKADGKWLIDFFHSTHLPDVNDKKYTTVHLLKVPGELSISALNDEIQKVNALIAGSGYPDCGYVIRNITQEEGTAYNYMVQGNWRNPEIYKIIHELDEYKKWNTESGEAMTPFYKDYVYLKAMMP